MNKIDNKMENLEKMLSAIINNQHKLDQKLTSGEEIELETVNPAPLMRND